MPWKSLILVTDIFMECLCRIRREWKLCKSFWYCVFSCVSSFTSPFPHLPFHSIWHAKSQTEVDTGRSPCHLLLIIREKLVPERGEGILSSDLALTMPVSISLSWSNVWLHELLKNKILALRIPCHLGLSAGTHADLWAGEQLSVGQRYPVHPACRSLTRCSQMAALSSILLFRNLQLESIPAHSKASSLLDRPRGYHKMEPSLR